MSGFAQLELRGTRRTSAAISQGFANFLTGNANDGFSQLSRDPVTDMKAALYEGLRRTTGR